MHWLRPLTKSAHNLPSSPSAAISVNLRTNNRLCPKDTRLPSPPKKCPVDKNNSCIHPYTMLHSTSMKNDCLECPCNDELTSNLVCRSDSCAACSRNTHLPHAGLEYASQDSIPGCSANPDRCGLLVRRLVPQKGRQTRPLWAHHFFIRTVSTRL